MADYAARAVEDGVSAVHACTPSIVLSDAGDFSVGNQACFFQRQRARWEQAQFKVTAFFFAIDEPACLARLVVLVEIERVEIAALWDCIIDCIVRQVPVAGADLLLVANDDYRVYPVNFGGHAYGNESVVPIHDIFLGHFRSCFLQIRIGIV